MQPAKAKRNRANTEATPAVRALLMQEVGAEHCFILRDGRTLKSINEMIAAFREMKDEVFEFHVNESKNDFANWVRDVFKDEGISSDLANASNRLDAEMMVSRNILARIIR